MIHRAMLGSLERFIGILIEHFAGAFPVWLAPVQVAILPITDRAIEHGQGVVARLKAAGFRAIMDARSEKIGRRSGTRSSRRSRSCWCSAIGRFRAARCP